MAEVVFIRHSRSALGAGGVYEDWPLSEEGRRLCPLLAAQLRPFRLNLLISSPQRRAHETAELVAQDLRIEWRTAPGLEEHHRRFVTDPDEFTLLMQQLFARPHERVFGEESADEARDRFSAAVGDVLQHERGRRIGIVSHGTVLALYGATFFGIGAGALWGRLGSPSFFTVDTEARRGLRIVDEIE